MNEEYNACDKLVALKIAWDIQSFNGLFKEQAIAELESENVKGLPRKWENQTTTFVFSYPILASFIAFSAFLKLKSAIFVQLFIKPTK